MRRIYGDFSGPHLRSWEKKLAGLAVIPHQQFAYTKGKNSSDIALVIDAMDSDAHRSIRRISCWCAPRATSRDWRVGCASKGLQVFGIGRTKHAGRLPQSVQTIHLHRESAQQRGGASRRRRAREARESGGRASPAEAKGAVRPERASVPPAPGEALPADTGQGRSSVDPVRRTQPPSKAVPLIKPPRCGATTTTGCR